MLRSLFPLFLRVVLPAALTAGGTTMSVLYSDYFRAFCGLQ